MTMQTQFHSEYCGCHIWRQWVGYALPYTARLPSGATVAADTLSGIKRTIRDRIATGD